MKNTTPLLILMLLLFHGCGHADRSSLLIGVWQKDSVYEYYNGFGFTKHDFDEEPLVQYQPDGKLFMKREDESRQFSYSLPHSDTLIHHNLNKMDRFIILKLDQNQLIIRKDLSPVFKGANQIRYEIRYFSKIKE